MTERPRRRSIAGLIACAAIVLGGCDEVSRDAQNRSLAALATAKPQRSARLPLGTPTERCRRDPYRSLTPSALPRPGRMPAGTFMRTLQDRGRFLVGVDQNSLGLGYFNPTSGMEGFDIDLVGEVARAIFGDTASIRYVALSTAQRDSAIVRRAVDIVASAFSINCERRNVMLFSSVYHEAKQQLLVPEGSKIAGLRDLRGKRICATKGSTSIDFLKATRAETGVVPWEVDLRIDCLVALQQGVVAAVTSDDAILLGFQRQDPQTKIVGERLQTESYGMAVNTRHPEFVRFVNAVLQRLRRNGCLAAMRRHWLDERTVAAPDRAYDRCTHRGR
ncbi:MAG: transporter substrate-binding domain-containing protein [Solirubrobacteraceae bacterium]